MATGSGHSAHGLLLVDQVISLSENGLQDSCRQLVCVQ